MVSRYSCRCLCYNFLRFFDQGFLETSCAKWNCGGSRSMGETRMLRLMCGKARTYCIRELANQMMVRNGGKLFEVI